MRRLSSLGSKQLAHRKGRSALTAGGIVLGVAILFGVLVSNATTQHGVDEFVRDIAGGADVLVRPAGAFDARMPASIVPRLRALPQVKYVAGSFSFGAVVQGPARTGARASSGTISIAVYGVELADSQKLIPYRLARGRFFAPGAREAIVPKHLATTLGIDVGKSLRLATPDGPRPVTVTGIMTDDGAGRTNQGDVAFTSLGAARAMRGAGDEITGARLVLDPGTDVTSWIKSHELALGPGVEFRDATTLARGFKDFLAILGDVFAFFAAMTLFTGAFLIYLTLSMAVIERTRIYGTMRALGATRKQIRRVVMAEALALGALSTIVGLALGLAVAKGLLALMASLFQLSLPGLTVRPGALAAAIAVGMVTTFVSSIVPAIRASRLSPVVAMKGGYTTDARRSRVPIVGAFMLATGALLGFAGHGAVAGAGATPLLLLGSVLVTPLALRPLARILGRATNKLSRGAGKVAVLHLVKERSRSAYTLALIMVVMAMIFSIGGLYTTMRAELDREFNKQFGSDLVLTVGRDNGPFGTLGPAFERELRAIPGVGTFTTVRFARVHFLGRANSDDFARIVDPATYFDVAGFSFVQGDERSARAALERGGAILLPAPRAAELNLKLGATVKVLTASGPTSFTLVGTYQTFGGPPETVFGLRDGRRYLNSENGSEYLADVPRGYDPQAVATKISSTLGSRFGVRAQTTGAFKRDAEEQFGRFFSITYAILLVAAIVGLLGLANTLAMSVLQRTREIGILRAIGTTRSQIRRMVLSESATLGLVAFVLALPLGYVMSILTVRGIESAFKFKIGYVYPAGWIPAVIAFGIVISVLAALAPGRRAARLDVVGALQYE